MKAEKALLWGLVAVAAGVGLAVVTSKPAAASSPRANGSWQPLDLIDSKTILANSLVRGAVPLGYGAGIMSSLKAVNAATGAQYTVWTDKSQVPADWPANDAMLRDAVRYQLALPIDTTSTTLIGQAWVWVPADKTIDDMVR